MSITSRVGRKPVVVPQGVIVTIENNKVNVKGPKGSLSVALSANVELVMDADKLIVKQNPNASYCRSGSGKKLVNSIPGTVRSQLYNAVHGVTTGFQKRLILVGVGYRAQMKGDVLSLALGHSHPDEFKTPEGVTIETPSLTEIIIKSCNKRLVGETAAKIMCIRPPEPYKGKGVVDPQNPITRKETKKK
jgi:large subunit ribosomal protein L6